MVKISIIILMHRMSKKHCSNYSSKISIYLSSDTPFYDCGYISDMINRIIKFTEVICCIKNSLNVISSFFKDYHT